MTTLNLGILAHVDAGKTSLTERLLFAGGVIDEIGSVDDGSTQTDTLALERQRGITIKSAVASLVIGDVTVNLIDTPGHPDFIAEVERVLSVLDGAVLVISAVEGVQAQTRVLMRTLRRLRLPTIIFVNKIDRGGAQYDGVLHAISGKLTPSIIAMGSVTELGTRAAVFKPHAATDAAFAAEMIDHLADLDDRLMAAFVENETAISHARLRDELATQAQRALIHPVFFGSAVTGAGLGPLITGIAELLPFAGDNAGDAVSGTVFKIERGLAGEKIAYVRMFTGTIRIRDRLPFGRGKTGKVTAISVFDRGPATARTSVRAGQIAKLWGLTDIQVGDTIGDTQAANSPHHHFAPPTQETVVLACRPEDKAALHVALTQLAEQDPLINLRQDGRDEISVSLYGEVQKEVIQATLADEFGVDVTFRETTAICVERPVGVGDAVEILGKEPNPFLATIGLRIEPAPINAGMDLRLDVDVESMPLFVYKTVGDFRNAIEEAVRTTLEQGLYGWQVIDYKVIVTRSGYVSPETSSGDFRKLIPMVVMSALKQAGTVVCEPITRFCLDGPADTLGTALRGLARLGAATQTTTMRGSSYLLEGEIPAARVHQLQRQLPGLTRGEGMLETFFDHYRQVSGRAPTRPRSDHNPLNRKEYLLHVVRRL